VIPGTYTIHVLCFGFDSTVDTVRVGIGPIALSPIRCTSLLSGIGYEKTGYAHDSPFQVSERQGTGYISDLPDMNDLSDYLEYEPGILRSRDGLHMRGGAAGELNVNIDDVSMINLLSTQIPPALPAEMFVFSKPVLNETAMDLSAGDLERVALSTSIPRNRIHAVIRYRTTSPGLNDASALLNERSVSGAVAGPLGKDQRSGFLLAARVKRSDDYRESGRRGPLGFPTGESTGEPFGFDDSDALYALTRWAPTGRTAIQLSYTGYHRVWKPYDHEFRYIPDSSSVHDSMTDIIGAALIHTFASSFRTRIRGRCQRFQYQLNHAGLGFGEYTPGIGIRDRNGEFLLSTGDAPFLDEELVSLSGDAEIQWRPSGRYMFSGGGEYARHSLSLLSIRGTREDTVNDIDIRPRETALYLQGRYMNRPFVLQGGFRLQSFDPDVTISTTILDDVGNERDAETVIDISPRFFVMWHPRGSFGAYVSHGYSARWPFLEFLYEGLGRELSESYPVIGNDKMEPAKSRISEIGVNYMPDTELVIRASAFRKNVDNMLGLTRISIAGFDSALYQYRGSGETDVAGTECELFFTWNHIISRVGYTYQVAEGRWSLPQAGDRIDEWCIRAASAAAYALDTDRRHTVKGFLIYSTGERPAGIEPLDTVCRNTVLSVTGEYGSGLPYTSDTGPEPNDARLPDTISFNARIARRFTVGSVHSVITLEVSNLFNRENPAVAFPSSGVPDHDGFLTRDYSFDPSLYAEPRLFYLGISFRY